MLSRPAAIILGMMALASCTYRGGDIGDPVTRKFHWFSYVEGEDIRATCQPGTPDRFRLVYNGLYHEQLRMYDLDSLRRLLVTRVAGDADLKDVDPKDLAAPWRADESRVQLDQATYDDLTARFAASGMFAAPPVGLTLPARSYHWTAAFCRDGAYGFTAWKHPSPAFAAITFDDALFALDATGIPVNAAKPVPIDPQFEDRVRRNEATDFTLKVGRSGLVH
ncbi:MAG: hypothetical protein AB1918_01470 [Pseudomonadota bacterium]